MTCTAAVPEHKELGGVRIDPSARLLQVRHGFVVALHEVQTIPIVRRCAALVGRRRVSDAEVHKAHSIIQLFGHVEALA